MSRAKYDQWVKDLSIVLLGVITSLRDDTQISAAEMTHGEAIRLPGIFLQPIRKIFLKKLRQMIIKMSAEPKRERRHNISFYIPNSKGMLMFSCDVTKNQNH